MGWYTGSIIDIDDDNNQIKIHYDGYSDKYDEFIDKNSDRIELLNTHTVGDKVGNTINVIYRQPTSTLWSTFFSTSTTSTLWSTFIASLKIEKCKPDDILNEIARMYRLSPEELQKTFDDKGIQFYV